jgi:hypothetical protein
MGANRTHHTRFAIGISPTFARAAKDTATVRQGRDRARLIRTRMMEQHHPHDMVAIVADMIGDEVLVRFGARVMQVPAKWLEPVGEH